MFHNCKKNLKRKVFWVTASRNGSCTDESMKVDLKGLTLSTAKTPGANASELDENLE